MKNQDIESYKAVTKIYTSIKPSCATVQNFATETFECGEDFDTSIDILRESNERRELVSSFKENQDVWNLGGSYFLNPLHYDVDIAKHNIALFYGIFVYDQLHFQPKSGIQQEQLDKTKSIMVYHLDAVDEFADSKNSIIIVLSLMLFACTLIFCLSLKCPALHRNKSAILANE
jgi:hypothetical protein